MIKFTPFFSGSHGNCALVQSGDTNVLLDIGYDYKSIVKRLEKQGLSPQDVHAIVITHEHSDHVGALESWAKHCQTQVFAPKRIAKDLATRFHTNVVGVDGEFAVGRFCVSTFVCSHDAKQCFGYRFCDGEDCFASVTDTGEVSDELIEFLLPCRTVQLESNHDVDMLRKGEYPFQLKRRILSSLGHLSNAQAGIVIEKLLGKVKNIVLAHLSENNNTPELAFSSALKVCNDNNFVEGKDVRLFVAYQRENGVTID